MIMMGIRNKYPVVPLHGRCGHLGFGPQQYTQASTQNQLKCAAYGLAVENAELRMWKSKRPEAPTRQKMCRKSLQQIEIASLPDVHQYLIPLHLHFIARHARHPRVLHDFSARQVELPPMPRAGHHRTLQLALSQRSALMQTRVVDGMELSRHVSQRNRLAAHFQFVDRPRCNLVSLCRANERHGYFQSPSSGTCALSTFASSSTNFCLRSVWSCPPSASANCVMFIEQNFGPHIEQNFASL